MDKLHDVFIKKPREVIQDGRQVFYKILCFDSLCAFIIVFMLSVFIVKSLCFYSYPGRQ